MSEKICCVEGCGGKTKTGKSPYCNKHYQRLQRTGSLELKPRTPSSEKICCVEGCGGKTRSGVNSYCEKHYARLKRTGSLELKPITTICCVEGCGGKVECKNYCIKHYARLRNYGRLELLPRAAVREDLFSKITAEEAWVLGLIWSDGNIRSNGNTISIVSKDLDLLEQVKSIAQGNDLCIKYRKVKREKHGEIYYGWMWVFAFSNKIIADRLRAMGLHGNKSRTIRYPKFLPDEFGWDFIRGVFDGDGCVYLDKKSSSVDLLRFNIITASEGFFADLKCWFSKEKIKYSTSSYEIKNGRMYVIKCFHKVCQILYPLLYKDDNVPRLKRKFDKFKYGVELKRPEIVSPSIKKYKNIENDVIFDYLHISKKLHLTASSFGINIKAVMGILKRNNIATYSNNGIFIRLEKEIKEKIKQERKLGLTYPEIEEKYKISKQIIRLILNEQPAPFQISSQ